MSSKRRIRRRSCTKKVRYATRADAREVAKRLHITTYHCQFCNGWHIGHTKRPPKYFRRKSGAQRITRLR